MARQDLKRGIFITFEGVEGCGKTTHAALLARYLAGCGYACIRTREPGGTRLGERVRAILLGADGVAIGDMTELFLFEACRAQIVDEVIRPALRKKQVVICDRFGDATVAYQGHGGGLPRRVIESLTAIASGCLKPDLTILLDIDIEEGLGRAARKGVDRMERKDRAYHRRVRQGYLAAARRDGRRIKVVRVSGAIGDVQERVRREADRVIRRYTRAG